MVKLQCVAGSTRNMMLDLLCDLGYDPVTPLPGCNLTVIR